MTAPEFARFLQQIYQILRAEATKYPGKQLCFRRLVIVQSELIKVLAIWEIKISLGGKGAWRDNVFVELLCWAIKYEKVYLHVYAPEERASIGRCVCNGRRPHSSIGEVIVELRDQHMRKQVWPRHAARDWTTWCGLLHHPLAAAAILLDPGNLDHLHLRRDHIEKLADIFTDHAQIAATVGAAGARIKLTALARGHIRDAWPTAQNGRIGSLWDRFIRPFVNGSAIVFGHGDQQVFQRQFQLFNLAFYLFRRLAEGQFLQLGNPQAQGLNQLIMDAKRGRYLCVSACKAAIIAFNVAGSSGKVSANFDMRLITKN